MGQNHKREMLGAGKQSDKPEERGHVRVYSSTSLSSHFTGYTFAPPTVEAVNA